MDNKCCATFKALVGVRTTFKSLGALKVSLVKLILPVHCTEPTVFCTYLTNNCKLACAAVKCGLYKGLPLACWSAELYILHTALRIYIRTLVGMAYSCAYTVTQGTVPVSACVHACML